MSPDLAAPPAAATIAWMFPPPVIAAGPLSIPGPILLCMPVIYDWVSVSDMPPFLGEPLRGLLVML